MNIYRNTLVCPVSLTITSVCPYAHTIAEHYARISWRDTGHKAALCPVS